MNKVLYEISPSFDFTFLIVAIAILAFTFIFTGIILKFYKGSRPTLQAEYVKAFRWLAVIFICLWLICFFATELSMHVKTVGAYKRGKYETVEGTVESFYTHNGETYSEESFEINGVEFSYSENIVQSGYHTPKSAGGVIEGDGQHLKIKYVYDESYGNIILYIEEITK